MDWLAGDVQKSVCLRSWYCIHIMPAITTVIKLPRFVLKSVCHDLGVVLPRVISTPVHAVQFPSRLRFDFHLDVFTLLEQSVGAGWISQHVLGFTVIAFGNASKAVDRDLPMNQATRG